MNMTTSDAVVTLGQDDFLSLHDAEGTRLMCVSGCLWITVDFDPRDIMLRAGESFLVDRPDAVLVQAVRPSQMRVRGEVGALAGQPWPSARPALFSATRFGSLSASLV